MVNFFIKHWRKIVLSLCALFWAGCNDDASSNPPPIPPPMYGCPDGVCGDPTGPTSFDKVACDLLQLCTAYGIIYVCDGVEMYGQTPDNPENCTIKSPPCQKNYICDDGIVCAETQANDIKKFDCKEGTTFFTGDKATATYNESEFNTKYYVKDNP